MKSRNLICLLILMSAIHIGFGQSLVCNSESCIKDIERVFIKIRKSKIAGVKKFIKDNPTDTFIEKEGIKINCLLIAVIERKEEIVAYLLEEGAHAHFEVKDGLTVYELAISTGNESIISLLRNESL